MSVVKKRIFTQYQSNLSKNFQFRNCYTLPSRLFVRGKGELKSQEGNTQGDAIAMGLYALGIILYLVLQCCFFRRFYWLQKIRILNKMVS